MTLVTTPRRPWTAEDDARLAELKARGMTDPEAARELGRTAEAVTSHRHWLREQAAKASPEAPTCDDGTDSIGRRAWTPREETLLHELRRQDESDEVIAAALGRSVSAVQGRACKLRLQGDADIPSRRRPAPLTAAQVDEARELHTQGLTLHQIAARLGTYPHAVARVVKPLRRDDEPDHTRTAAALDEARAALVRAQERHRDAMDALTEPVWAAIKAAGLIVNPAADEVEDGPAWALVDQLRRQGLELRRVA